MDLAVLNNICGVTGHRDIPEHVKDEVYEKLRQEMQNAFDDGYIHYVSGFARGIDLDFAEIVIALKREYKRITLEAALPFSDSVKSKNPRFHKCLKECDHVEMVNGNVKFSKGAYLERDDYIVTKVSRLIAVYDNRQRGGTYYTIRQAEKAGVDIRIIPV